MKQPKGILSKAAYNISRYYESEIFSKIYFIRGTTRLKYLLRRLAVNAVSSKVENGYRLDIADQEPVFDLKQDLRPVLTENKFVNLFEEKTEGTEVFCDVGSYHGFYSFISNSEESIAFEADPFNYSHLETNMWLNAPDMSASTTAVWSHSNGVNMDAGNEGRSKVGEDGLGTKSVTLDEFFEDRQDPDVIKIDVEGAEGHVLEGAKQVLERSKPTLFIEVHLNGRIEDFGHSHGWLSNFLMEHGYDIEIVQSRVNENLIMCEHK